MNSLSWVTGWSRSAALTTLLATGLIGGCGGRKDDSPKDVSRLAKTFLASTAVDRVLGMEAPTTDWSILYSGAGTLGSSTTATQGTTSLSLKPHGWVPLQSAALSSLGSRVGTAVQLDMQFQGTQPNQWWWGTVTIGVDIPSLGVQSGQNGMVVNQSDLTNKLSSGWNTLTFNIPTALQTALAGNYSDLQVMITLNVPAESTGTYLIDNLRFLGGSGTSTGTGTNTSTGTGTATNTGTQTGTATGTGTATVTSTVTATSTGTSGGGSCLSNWRATACGQWCVDLSKKQQDLGNCAAFLDCYQQHDCSRETCTQNPTDVCNSNNVVPHLGNAGLDTAAVVWQCLSCPGSTPVTSCAGIPDTAPCTDGNPCTKGDRCSNGTCKPGAAVTCPGDQCNNSATCDPATGACPKTPKPTGTACDDGDACTEDDQCNSNGTCVGSERQCTTPPDGQCYEATGSCVVGACAYVEKTGFTPCNDKDSDTQQDSCKNGKCMGISAAKSIVPADQGDTVQSQLPGDFAVSSDGAATYVVPVDVPEGRAGISPKVSLTYNSQTGDGIVGVGWTLNGASSRIARCAKIAALDAEPQPISFASSCDTSGKNCTYSDRFCLDGDYLVLAKETTVPGGGLEWRPEHNPSIRVTMKGTNDPTGPDSFLVEYPDGKKAVYKWVWYVGRTTAIANHKTMDPTIEQTDSSTVRFAWLVSSVSDAAGNTMAYTYKGDAEQWVPGTISYTSFVKNGTTTTPALRQVVFNYTIRTDAKEEWFSGVRLKSKMLLHTIDVIGPSPTQPDTLWTYSLGYSNYSVSGRSLLTSLQQCEKGGTCKLATTFDWEKGASTFSRSATIGAEPPMGATGKVADFDGDGLPDIMTATASANGGIVIYWATLTDGALAYSSRSTAIPYDKLEGPDPLVNITPFDMDGDGKAEIVVRQKENGKQWLRYYSFDVSQREFVQIPDDGNEVPDNIDPYIYFADLDGDGLTELIRAVNGKWMYRKNKKGILAPYALLGPPASNGSTIPINALNEYNNFVGDLDGSGRQSLLLMAGGADVDTRYKSVSLSRTSSNGVVVQDSTVPWIARTRGGGMGKALFDLNGDGLADAVEYLAGPMNSGHPSTSFINLGRGMLGGSPNFSDPIANTRERIYSDDDGNDIFMVMDVNQDGLSDLVSAPDYIPVEGSPLGVFLSNGQALTEPVNMYHSAGDGGGVLTWDGSSTGKWFRAYDANGDGLTDFMMQYEDLSSVTVYLHDGKKADMITAIHGGSGASTVVTYSPWNAGSDDSVGGCGYPVSCPKRGLWVVSEYHVEPGNGLAPLPARDYVYEGAAFDALGRGWLGFQKEYSHEAGTDRVVATEYQNTLRIGTSYPFSRLPKTVTDAVWVEDGGEQYSYSVSTYEVTNGVADPSGQSFAVALTERTYDEYEQSATGHIQEFRSLDFQQSYDERNNLKKSSRYGLLSSTYDAVEATYLNDTANWILSPVTTRTLTSAANGESFARSETYDYDSTWPRFLNKITIEPKGDASEHLETKISGRSQFGLLTAVDAYDLNGAHRTSSLEYDELEGSRLGLTTNAAGHTMRTAYHMGLNLPIWQRDANGVETSAYYYPFGRLQSVVFADGNRKTMSYVAPSVNTEGVLETRATLASGESSSRTTDSVGRSTSGRALAMNGKTTVQRVTYDPIHPGSVASISVAKFEDDLAADRFTQVAYDLAGRVKTVTTPDNRTITKQYAGTKTTTTDAKGNVSYVVSDDLGRTTQSVHKMVASDDGGAREIPINYTFGPFGALRKVADVNNNVVETRYDNLGRVSQILDPDRGNKSLTHDAFDVLVSLVDSKGTTSFTPDALGRNTKIVSPDGIATYTWDTAANGIGQLASSTSSDGVAKAMTYDTLSRLNSETWTITGENYTVGLSYDNVGRPHTVSYPDVPGFSTFKTQHNYASNGDLLSLTDVPSGGEVPKLFWKVDERDESGRIKVEEFGDTAKTTYGIDRLRGVVTGITTTIGQSVLQSLGYDYDRNLNLKTRGDSVVGLAETFEHDSLNRLHTWSEVGAYGWSVTYGHDDIGNLTSRSLLGVKGETESLTFAHSGVNAGPHAVTNSAWGTYGYDTKGNMVSSPEGTIDYTWFNLPKKIVGTDTTTFEYDADGERVLKQSTGTTGTTVYAGGLYERRSVAGAKTHVFYLNAAGRQIGQVVRKESDKSETVLFIHTDALGTSEVVTGAGGNLVGQRRKYDPFGSPMDMTLPKAIPGGRLMSGDVRLGFTGQEEDSETGLINMKGRIYDPHVGHFLTPDPIVNDPFSPVGLNPYAYVMNNPLRYTDPSGFQGEEGYTISGLVLVGETSGYGGGAENPNPCAGEGSDSGGGGGGGNNPWDPSNWIGPNNPWIPYPIQRLSDARGTLAMRLPGGGWMRNDNPNSVYFATGNGRAGAMSVQNWLTNYTYVSDPANSHNQQVRDNLGEISDNPIIDVVSNRVATMAVGGQSAANGRGMMFAAASGGLDSPTDMKHVFNLGLPIYDRALKVIERSRNKTTHKPTRISQILKELNHPREPFGPWGNFFTAIRTWNGIYSRAFFPDKVGGTASALIGMDGAPYSDKSIGRVDTMIVHELAHIYGLLTSSTQLSEDEAIDIENEYRRSQGYEPTHYGR